MKPEQRAGRVLSGANERKLRDAVTLLSDVLAQLGEEENGVRSLPGVELRSAEMGGVELRADEDGRQTIIGHAAVFNRLSVMIYGFREQIAPGAFADSLNDDIRALWQHDSARVLGRTKAGTLKLAEDKRGLAFEIAPPDTQDGRDATTLIGRGDVDQMSFGFTVPMGGDEWDEDESGIPIRTLKRVRLLEISPVTFPAYPDTSASVLRSAPEWVQRALTQGVNDKDANEIARARIALRKRHLNLLNYGGYRR